MKGFLALLIAIGFSCAVHADTISKRFMLSQLNNRSGGQNVAIISNLREYVQESEVRSVLFDYAQNDKAQLAERIEAIYSLSKEATNSRTYQMLMKLYQNETDTRIQAAILKSLHIASSGSSLVQRFLVEALTKETEATLREAALFGLKESSQNSRIFEMILQVANDQNQLESVRVQAIKSLYLARTNNRVEKFVSSLIQNPNELKIVRISALKLFQNMKFSNLDRDLLISIAQKDSDNEIKQQAILSLKEKLSNQDVEWLNPRFYPNAGMNIERDCL